MNLKNQKLWEDYEEKNKDHYGGACVAVAREAMKILDKGKRFNASKLICKANDKAKTGGITGFMAGCVASMISDCHERGEEFRRQWNQEYGIKEEDDKGGTVNPALLTISTKA